MQHWDAFVQPLWLCPLATELSISLIILTPMNMAGDKIEKNEMGLACGTYEWGEVGV